jgi:hypothetical protein
MHFVSVTLNGLETGLLKEMKSVRAVSKFCTERVKHSYNYTGSSKGREK